MDANVKNEKRKYAFSYAVVIDFVVDVFTTYMEMNKIETT